MNDENTSRLLEAAPNLYGERFYFECGDGWFDILLEASTQLQNKLLTFPESIRQDIVASQVKEKYGTLGFYLSYYTEELDEIIVEVEKKSATICETCGNHGKVKGSIWLYTACDEHTRPEDKQTSESPDKSQ